MGHVKSYYNLTIYITYHKHLVKDIISSELNKSSTTKSKIVCFLHSLPINYFRRTPLAFIRVNGHYKHHTPLTTTHKFENLHALQRKLDAFTPTVRPSSPVLAKKKSLLF